jgi:AhpD family alkylhydroperoxidase
VGVTTGAATLRHVAPDSADALASVIGALWAEASASGTTAVVATVAARTADLLGLEPLTPPHGAAGAGWKGDSSAVLAFAEQCCLDVASISPTLRDDFLAATGPLAGGLVASLWVVDMVPRTRAALVALFGPGGWPPPQVEPAPAGIWGALDRLMRVVPALDALDPVTSELVRLRGARQHDCRLCRSLRSRSALRAGATEAEFDAVDHYADSSLSALARASLAFCDAMLWTPGRIGADVVAALQAEARPDQQVELVLDVTRNALNKVAVALGADAAHVEDGIEVYDVEPDGSLVYGLAPD